AAPDAARNELERPRADFLARAGHADDRRFAPAFVTALERCAHELDVTDRFERIIDAAVRHVDDDLLYRLVVVLWIHEIRRAERARHFFLARIDVDRDDAAGLRDCSALDAAQADAAQAEDRDRRAGLD